MQFIEGMRQLSPRELGMLGMEDVAYIKPVVEDGVEAFAVCAADGTQMAVIADRNLARVDSHTHAAGDESSGQQSDAECHQTGRHSDRDR